MLPLIRKWIVFFCWKSKKQPENWKTKNFLFVGPIKVLWVPPSCVEWNPDYKNVTKDISDQTITVSDQLQLFKLYT